MGDKPHIVESGEQAHAGEVVSNPRAGWRCDAGFYDLRDLGPGHVERQRRQASDY